MSKTSILDEDQRLGWGSDLTLCAEWCHFALLEHMGSLDLKVLIVF